MIPKPLEITTLSDTEIVVRRAFDAPAAMVWRCFTEPALIPRRYGLPDWEMTVCEYDAKVGGKWRFVTKSPSGYEMGSQGVIKELVEPRRIVNTELYDQDWTGGETLITTVFHDDGPGSATVTLLIRYANREGRDAALATPMAEGMEIGFKRLDATLSELGR